MPTQPPLHSTTDPDRTPEPAYARLSRRAAASFIDSMLMLVALIGTFAVVPVGATDEETASRFGRVVTAFFAVLVLYEPVAHGFFGRTVGKRAMRIRLVTTAREKVGFGRALLRQVVKLGLAVVPLLALLDALNAVASKRRQTVHDSAARTIVVRDS